MLERECDHMVRNDRVTWGACMVGCGDADAMVTGGTRHHAATVEKLTKVVEARPGEIIFGLTLMVSRGRTVFIADTNVHDNPTAKVLNQPQESKLQPKKSHSIPKRVLPTFPKICNLSENL